MCEKGGDIKRQSWASSRSSSGEGPDEVTVNEDLSTQHTAGGTGSIASHNYSTAATAATATTYDQAQLTKQDTLGQTTNQEFESSGDTSKLFAESDDLKSKLRELNIGSLDEGQDG